MDRLDCDRMFVAVLDLGSFSAAAARLGTSAGQASKLVSRLEAELGAQLLKRTTRALAPTEQGRAYHARVKALLEEYDALTAAARDASATPVGRVRISVPISFGTLWLVPAFIAFAEMYPGIEIDAVFSDRVVHLVDEGFDLAVRIGAPADSALIARRLCPMRIVTTAAPRYLEARGWPERVEDLEGRECVIDGNFRDPLVWRFRDPAGGIRAVSVTGRLRFSNAEACAAAAEAGLGVAHGPSFIVGEAVRTGRLRPILTRFDPAPLDVSVLYPPARYLAVKVRVLVDFLVARFRGEPDWDRDWPIASDLERDIAR